MTTPSSAPPPAPEPGKPLPADIQVPQQRTESPALTPVQLPSKSSGPAFAAITLLGGLLLVVGSFLPWVTVMAPFVGTLSRSGLDGGGDGIVTLVVGVVTLGIGAARLALSVRPIIQRTPILFGALALWVAIYDLYAVHDKVASISASPYMSAYAGSGLYLLVVGAVVTVAGGLVVTRSGALPRA